MKRSDGRKANQLRPVEITRGYTRYSPGSVLIRTGNTVVLCTASFESKVPEWMAGKGAGWVTAEYDMLPGSTGQRRPRSRNKVDGRAQEIQRLIGRCMRAIIDREQLGENTIWLDCDVLQADGGTRTAAITGAYVALCDAVRWAIKQNKLTKSPVREAIAAISAGIVEGKPLLDLCYTEDVAAEVDMNIAMTSSGRFVEVQGTGEDASFSRKELNQLVDLGVKGIRQLLVLQQRVLLSPLRRKR